MSTDCVTSSKNGNRNKKSSRFSVSLLIKLTRIHWKNIFYVICPIFAPHMYVCFHPTQCNPFLRMKCSKIEYSLHLLTFFQSLRRSLCSFYRFCLFYVFCKKIFLNMKLKLFMSWHKNLNLFIRNSAKIYFWLFMEMLSDFLIHWFSKRKKIDVCNLSSVRKNVFFSEIWLYQARSNELKWWFRKNRYSLGIPHPLRSIP